MRKALRRCRLVRLASLLLLPGGCWLLGGCGINSETLETLQQVSLKQQDAVADLDRHESRLPSTPGVDFQVPFPQRDNPFAVSTDSPDRFSETALSTVDVQVKGFAKIGQQQAILRVKGETRFVIVGDRIGGLEVLAIVPPRVRLKSGNLVWDANMFSNNAAGSKTASAAIRE